MHLKSEDIIRIELEYHSGEIPPPFSHTFKIRMSFEKKFINTQFEITYTHREDLSEEDITSEGFTLDDDFRFVGEIPLAWQLPFKKLYSQSKWTHQKTLGAEGGMRVLAKDVHDKLVRSVPYNTEEWLYLAQEYIQAIYEVSKKEAPLIIRFKTIENDRAWRYEMEVKFATRKINMRINGAEASFEWEEARELLGYIYLPDYDYAVGKASEPTKPGSYIDCGDGIWHDFRTGVINLDDSFDAKEKIQEILWNLKESAI